MSGGDGYLTNPLYREIAKLMTDAGITHRVEQGAKHFHVKFWSCGREMTQILHLGPNSKGSTYRKTVIRFRKIAAAERAYVAPQTSPELNLEQPVMSEPAQEAAKPSFDLALHIVGEEPRVLDTDLAATLGMARLTNVRTVIEANRDELETFGSLHAANANPSASGGRPGTAYYLNEEQAALVVMLSRTPQAKKARAEIIRVFTAWRRGQLAPAVAEVDSATMKETAKLSASAAGGAAKNAIAPVSRQFDSKMALFDDRLTKQAKFSAEWRRETNTKLEKVEGSLSMLASLLSNQMSAVVLQALDLVDVGAVYEIAGVALPVRSQALLTNNIKRGLDNWCVDHRVPMGNAKVGVGGKRVRYWPKTAVADWLAAEGHALIDRHMRANARKPNLVSISQS